MWLHKPAIPARGSLSQKIWSWKLAWAKKRGPVLGRKNLKENKEKCKPSQCGREQETGADWSSLSTTDVTMLTTYPACHMSLYQSPHADTAVIP